METQGETQGTGNTRDRHRANAPRKQDTQTALASRQRFLSTTFALAIMHFAGCLSLDVFLFVPLDVLMFFVPLIFSFGN